MSLRLYDTASRCVRDFVPIRPGRVGIYLCGATVQSPPHVGHVRSSLAFDVLRRWLARSGFEVTLVRNVTDIDDKILRKAADEGVPWWALAARNERAFSWAYDVLNCLPATIEPRATGHVPQMVALISRLIDNGSAYAVGGDVYFAVRSLPDYGALSGQRLDELQAAADSESEDKRDPRDFALWKGAKPALEGQPAEPVWWTPWGGGRPGWHVECSAMAEAYLGPVFDIHGGGLDLVFPHHENERAQSNAAGHEFAHYWLHNAWVTTAGEKMSKSLGNSLLVTEVVKRVRPVELRYYLISAHYRSHQEFSDASLAEAAKAYARIEGFVRRAQEVLPGHQSAVGALPPQFVAAMDDDLAVPQALAVLHETVTAGNRLLSEGATGDELALLLASVTEMLDVLGIEAPAAGTGDSLRATVDALVAVTLEQRAAARTRKDWAGADAIRDGLKAAGIAVEDTAHGPRWEIEGGAG